MMDRKRYEVFHLFAQQDKLFKKIVGFPNTLTKVKTSCILDFFVLACNSNGILNAPWGVLPHGNRLAARPEETMTRETRSSFSTPPPWLWDIFDLESKKQKS